MDTAIPRINNYPDWGFVCGRISALEGKLLSKDFFQSLVVMTRYDDIFQHLQDSFLREYLIPGVPWEDFTALVDRCFYDLAFSLRRESPSPAPANLFLCQGDYLNLKNALSGLKDFPFLPGEVSLESVQTIAGGNLADLPPVFPETVRTTGSEAKEFDPTVSDMVVDGAYLRHLLFAAEGINSPLIRVCIHDRVLAGTISVLWRALRKGRPLKLYRQYFLPLGEYSPTVDEMIDTGNPEGWVAVVGGGVGDILDEALQWPYNEQVSRFELLAVNHCIRLAADGRLQTAGPERVFAFLTGLHSEMQNLKLAVSGRLNRIESTLLKERLREVYG
ncbi:MAG: V-type ATP synthase subunit C [Syntrophorhabdus sp. PtaU1.Bin050]|jgi:V/A-type H+-transporting ATPase subunit C|nr:MAG: V-type ATP synthase subunit C [Syntrophorhabdus sp. PtaU1.Bin050]